MDVKPTKASLSSSAIWFLERVRIFRLFWKANAPPGITFKLFPLRLSTCREVRASKVELVMSDSWLKLRSRILRLTRSESEGRTDDTTEL